MTYPAFSMGVILHKPYFCNMKSYGGNFAVLMLMAFFLALPQGRGQDFFDHLPALRPAYVNNFSAGNNLPEACISDVMEDRKGRLWLASCQGMAGLNAMRMLQFDGYNFFPANLANDSLPKPSLAIFKACLPSGALLGCLETANINALFLFEPETQRTQTLPFNLQSEGALRDIQPGADGTVYVLSWRSDSLALYAVQFPSTKRQIAVWKNGGRPDLHATFGYSIFVRNGNVLVISNDPVGIQQVDLNTGAVQALSITAASISGKQSDQAESFNDRFYSGFATQDDGAVFAFLFEGQPQVYRQAGPGAAFEPYQPWPQGYTLRRMEKDSVGNLLFLFTDKSLKYKALLRDRNGRFFNYSEFVTGYSVIHSLRSRNFFKSVYLCTQEGFFYKTSGGNEHVLIPVSGKTLGVRGMFELPDGRIFATFQNGPGAIYDPVSGKAEYPAPNTPLRRAMGNGICWKFLPAPDGKIWTFRIDTLVCYDPGANTSEDFAVINRPMIYERLNDGRIVYTTFDKRGLYFFDPRDRSIQPWVNQEELKANMQGFVHDIRQLRDGRLCVLTTNGFLLLDLNKGREQVFGLRAPFRDTRFICMTEAPDGRLWLGTFLGGIQIFNPRDGSVKVVEKGQGLPSNTVVFILPDGNGNFIAGTYNGLSLLSADGVVRSNFSRQEGLQEVEFNRFAYLRSKKGDFYLGTVAGLQVFSPDFFQTSTSKGQMPRLYLTSIALMDAAGKEINLRTGFEKLPALILPPEHRELTVQFALSNYEQPERNQFAYMLEGLDQNWTHIGAKHELHLGNLPPGQYTLLITGCDFKGNCVGEPIRIPVHAREFFYKQTWFYLLCAMPFLAFGLIWVRRLRSEKKRLEEEVQKRTTQIQQDKTLIEQQARELRQLDEAKSRFFTNISHELRTPITLITAPVEHLLRQFPAEENDEETRRSLHWVLYNGRKLSSLVEELLELSRLEAGKTELLETPAVFYLWCRQIFSAFESQAAMKRIDFQFDFQADREAVLLFDRKRLEKILNNLISNALKFTAQGGVVEFSVKAQSTENETLVPLDIRVRDTGRGIPPEDLPHVFERYFQTKRDDIPRGGGTGIGLALARELVQWMKGELQVESEWGKGSTFYLQLSLKKAAKNAVLAISEEQQPLPKVVFENKAASFVASDGPGKDKLLIVEDNPDMQALLRTLLSGKYDLTLAGDGQEAWELLQGQTGLTDSFDLILSDVMMPRMDGYELLAKLKADARWRQTPLILLTARAEQDDKIEALQLGVDDYVVKPFSPAELLARVANLISNYRERKAFAARPGPVFDFEKVEAREDQWLKQIEKSAREAIEKGLPLQVAYLADAGAMSERQFYRELKRLTGLTPLQYIQEVRLQKARHLLMHRAYSTISEVAYAVGFETPTYFSKLFEQHFGKHPSAFLHPELSPDIS